MALFPFSFANFGALANGNPALGLTNRANAEISQCRMIFRKYNAFGSPNNVQVVRVNLSNEQWCAMAKNVTVIGTRTGVDQK